MSDDPPKAMSTYLGYSTSDEIFVQGHHLTDLMGTIDLGAMVFLEFTGRLPSSSEARMFNALLVTAVDHGITPSVIAARSTHLGAPEALQGAVAAGLLGTGTRFLGPADQVAQLLDAALSAGREPDDAMAAEVVDTALNEQGRVPGFGHPIHRNGDPRPPRLFQVAHETAIYGRACSLLQSMVPHVHTKVGKPLPLNAAGTVGAIVCDMDLDPQIGRGTALIARTVGLVAHIFEEKERPLAPHIWDLVRERAEGPSSLQTPNPDPSHSD